MVSHGQAATPDRTYRFGDDTLEGAAAGATPNAPGIGAVTLDSQVFNTVGFTDASDLNYTGTPTYFNTGSGALTRPGAATGTLGLQFNGTTDVLFRTDRGLGVPAQADDNYGTANNAPGYATITTRYIDGWVRQTGGRYAARRHSRLRAVRHLHRHDQQLGLSQRHDDGRIARRQRRSTRGRT